MRIGVDLDNTIVCYDGVFKNAALHLGLVPMPLKADKTSIRDYLRQGCREQEWIRLQGHIYGPGMREAKPFDGVLEFIRSMSRSADIFIISHRTRHPYDGPKHDLHAAAGQWLREHSVTAQAGGSLDNDRVFFELSLDAKIDRIKRCGCTHFIDDLPNVLQHKNFPTSVSGILFDAAGHNIGADRTYKRHSSWHDIQAEFRINGSTAI